MSWFGISPKAKYITRDEVAKVYEKRPSLLHKLPWRDYNEKHKCFLLEDNESLGVCFELTTIPCEARPFAMLEEITSSVAEAIKNSIPCEKENPWVLQTYISRNPDLKGVFNDIESYFPVTRKETPFTQAYLENLNEHFDFLSRDGGIFQDTQVTNMTFRGGVIHVYAVLYRRYSTNKKKQDSRRTHLEEIVIISRKFADQLRSCGMKVKRMNGSKFYAWMSQWFNPKHQHSETYPADAEKPYGFDLSEQLFFSAPESFEGGWLFDGMPHKVMTIQNMTISPVIGHVSAERKRSVDDKVFNLIDNLPEGSIFVTTITLQAPSEVELHLKKVDYSAVGMHALAVKVKSEIATAETAIANGDYLFPISMAVYLQATSMNELNEKQAKAEVLLNSNGFKVITEDELFPIDAYLRYLPMCYDYTFDKKHTYRSRYMQLSDIAKLLPFYGRSRGTGNAGMVMMNRGGEPWTYDIMVDKSKNAHLLVSGETGTGKSNLLNLLITHDIALYNSRFFIVEVGGTFNALGDYCQSLGLTVNKITIDPRNPVSLNPFAHGLRLIDQLEAIEDKDIFIAESCERLLNEQKQNAKPMKNDHEDDNEPRDILGDMVLAALIMITGGESREEESIRRSDRMLIMDAIINAAYHVKAHGREQMIAEDIVEAFERVAKLLDPSTDSEKMKRARDMADAMRYFTKDPVSSKFFNTHGSPWELADITIINFGLFANEGYEAHRSIAFAGCMTNIQSLAEANQHSGRGIKVVCDENHIFTSIKLLAAIETRILKTGRKLGLWFWIATQNMQDFPDEARRMLSQIEIWLCLALPPDEIDQIERFKPLSAEQRELFLSARKEKGKYTEGVLLSPKMTGLFRNVPPRLYLAMAATDQDEKHHRATLRAKYNCTEIEAIKMIAKGMMEKKSVVYHDE
jgi:conjugative transfer ATPase